MAATEKSLSQRGEHVEFSPCVEMTMHTFVEAEMGRHFEGARRKLFRLQQPCLRLRNLCVQPGRARRDFSWRRNDGARTRQHFLRYRLNCTIIFNGIEKNISRYPGDTHRLRKAQVYNAHLSEHIVEHCGYRLDSTPFCCIEPVQRTVSGSTGSHL